MTLPTPPDIHSEDSVFRKLFSDEKKPRKVTKAERMKRVFADAMSTEGPIKVSDFLPSY